MLGRDLDRGVLGGTYDAMKGESDEEKDEEKNGGGKMEEVQSPVQGRVRNPDGRERGEGHDVEDENERCRPIRPYSII